METQLRRMLSQVQHRLRQAFYWERWAALGGLAMSLALLVWLSDQVVVPQVILGCAAATLIAAIAVAVSGHRRYRSTTDVARCVEQAFPELEQRLFTCVTQLQRRIDEAHDPLTRAVIRQTTSHAIRHHWTRVVPASHLRKARLATVGTFLVAAALAWQVAQRPLPINARMLDSSPAVTPTTTQVTVSPGATDVERGLPLVVAAAFEGAIPREVTLWTQTEDGTEVEHLMPQRLADPVFAVQIPRVDQVFVYRIKYADELSDTYRVGVFELPELLQADARLTYPDYTALPDKQILDTRRVTAVEGSRLTWIMRLNKSVAEAWLQDEQGQRVELRGDDADPTAYSTEMQLSKNQRWKLHLVDADSRRNKFPADFQANVQPNQRPTLKPTTARDLTVSPLEEITVGASLWDDFGVHEFGVGFALAAQPVREVKLGNDVAARQEQKLDYLLDFEKLDAAPDQLLAYHFWVADMGPDGHPRRTRSDIYFAEVRHFEEIFREGQAPTGGGGGAASSGPTDDLLQLQKEILAATWNLDRGVASDAEFSAAANVLIESQQSALSRLNQIVNRLPQTARVETSPIQQPMQQAIEHLTQARDEHDRSALADAATAEQLAYQGLLGLRARTHEVARSQGGGGAGGQGRQRQQIQELELGNQEQRYETQRQSRQNSAQDENQELRQILSRLRDLARRQKDINQQLRDLQSALQKEQSLAQRAEIERQLKRLRDQQEEMLRDADDVEQRVSQAQNQPQMRNTQQQLEQSRDRLQQSTQAVSQGDVAQALASGTRAEQQFQQMSEQLRQQAANEFTDRMQDMQEDAQQLLDRQQTLQQELTKLESSDQPGLRSNDKFEETEELMDQQQSQLSDLLKDMEQTVRDAESTEPLLAQKLYDALRKANQQRTADKLTATRQLLENGLRPQAREAAAETGTALNELKAGVDDAAQGILADQLEGLRRAAGMLSEMSEQLQQEMHDQADPAPTNRPSSDGGRPQGRGRGRGQNAASGSPTNDAAPAQPSPGSAASGSAASGSAASGSAASGSGQAPADVLRTLGGGSGPITGDGFVPWSDRLRDIEEMVDDSELRSSAAQIRDRARSLRRDMKRHSQQPQWSLIEELIATPLEELRLDVEQELARRGGQRQALVPIDRDPIPATFRQRVQDYYQRLGTGR